MSCELANEPMEIDGPEEGKESPDRVEGNDLLQLYPVNPNDSGIGLPYAPKDWPNPGDEWRWKVGKRTNASGHYLDRYMYVPGRLREPGQKKGFASKLSLEQFVRAKFPNADVDAFFASFSWKIPSPLCKKDSEGNFRPRAKPAESNGLIDEPHCKAGNRFCSSLTAGEEPSTQFILCDVCCGEPNFCRDCCCILCCQSMDKASESHSYITCGAVIEGSTCGHSCHFSCALKSFMVGTVDKSVGLDAEYYCRRCDSRTDLVSHIAKLLQKCESNVSRDDVEKTLGVGISLLSGSRRTSAKQLLHHIQLAMSKLKDGICPQDIWHKEDDDSADSAGVPVPPKANGALELQDFDYRVESLKLDDEIDDILESLRKAQQSEYLLAEERLTAQKNFVINLYEQLDRERATLSRHTSTNDHDSLLDSVLSRIGQVKREVSQLKDMREVANGFGKVPKRILQEHFGLNDVEHS